MKKVYEVRMENWEYRNRKNNLTTNVEQNMEQRIRLQKNEYIW